MALKITNNATSVLAGSIDDSVTTFSVASGAGALFPTLGGDDWFPLTIVNADGDYEIVRCTERSGDLFTVTRAQEGTAAASFDAGSRVDLRLTAAAITAVTDAVDTLSGNLPSLYVAIANLASQAEAEAGSANDKWMSALRVQQAIDALNLAAMAQKGVATAADISANTGSDGLTTDQAWAAAARVLKSGVSGSLAIDADEGSSFYINMTGNVTVNTPTNLKSGQVINFCFVQAGGGGHTISWSGNFVFPDGQVPLVTSSAGSYALVGAIWYDGTYCHVSAWRVT